MKGMIVMKELLLRIKEYIEEAQENIDSEWGSCRSVEDIINDGEMPDIYNDLIKAISKLEG